MRKYKTYIIVGASIISIIAVSLFLYINNITHISGISCGTAIFKYGEMHVEENFTNEDLKFIVKAFNGKLLLKDNPSCGFTDNVAIILGSEQVFCIACDTCPIIYWKNKDKYFCISEKNNERFRNILKKYGFHFPCI